MKDEAEFAMKYSEERKMRIALETRLEALMYESMATANMAYTLVRNIIDKDLKESTETIQTLVRWRGDLEANWFLNAFKPVGANRYVTDEAIDSIVKSSDVYNLMDHTVHNQFEDSGKAASKEWNEYAETKGFPTTQRLIRIHREWLVGLIEGATAKNSKAKKAKNAD